MKRVGVYARVSTTDQSTESQLLDLRRYVSERGWDIFKEYVDETVEQIAEHYETSVCTVYRVLEAS